MALEPPQVWTGGGARRLRNGLANDRRRTGEGPVNDPVNDPVDHGSSAFGGYGSGAVPALHLSLDVTS